MATTRHCQAQLPRATGRFKPGPASPTIASCELPRPWGAGGGGLPSSAAILALQRTVGNAAVARLLPGGPVRGSILRLPTKRQVEDSARDVVLSWIRSPDRGEAIYKVIGPAYEALLRSLDAYHATAAQKRVLPSEKHGSAVFASEFAEMLAPVHDACERLFEVDDELRLRDARNLVVRALREEEQVVVALTHTEALFMYGAGWDSQFAGKSFADALRIARFVLPLYQGQTVSGRPASSERAFVKVGGLPRELPKRGFKLHVSVHDLNLEKARDVLMPVVAGAGHTVKIVADAHDLTGGQTGKILTVYPKTAEQARNGDFGDIVGKIEAAAKGAGILPGPAVSGEKPLGSYGIVYLEENAQIRG